MMLTEVRERVAADLRTALGPDVPVFGYWPGTPTVPCVVVEWGEFLGGRLGNAWKSNMHLTVIAGGGDNDATTGQLEQAVETVARAVNGTWQRPGQAIMGGQVLLTAVFDVIVNVNSAGTVTVTGTNRR